MPLKMKPQWITSYSTSGSAADRDEPFDFAAVQDCAFGGSRLFVGNLTIHSEDSLPEVTDQVLVNFEGGGGAELPGGAQVEFSIAIDDTGQF
jgi:hypothetical protein